MAAKVMIPVEEYLRTEFDGADCEYVEGVVLEHNMGRPRHGKIQLWLGVLLGKFAQELGIQAASEVRIRVSASRYRIPDVAVWRRDAEIGEDIPAIPPFLAVEILSPDDRAILMMAKVEEYLAVGIEWVWIVDPYEGKAIMCSQQHPALQSTDLLRTEDPAIEIAVAEILNPGI